MISEISYPCKIDRSMQKAMFLKAQSNEPRPLVVALHTWSYHYDAVYEGYADFCEKNDWNMIFPDFRGPNDTPEACGSDFVVSDIEDAVAYMKTVCNVDPNRIYLVGGSGGGHCTLLLAGRRPDIWTAVSAWCPITDVAAWHRQCLNEERFKHYSQHIEKACGGNPAENDFAAKECLKRSPLSWLANAKDLIVDISTGIHDGHTGSVPISHTFNAFNILANSDDRITEKDIEYAVVNEQIPPSLAGECSEEPSLNGRKVHFRRQSENTRITIFEGGHDLIINSAMQFLAKQIKGKKADWSANCAADRNSSDELSK